VGLLLIISLTRSGDRIRDEEELAAIMGAPILARIPAARRSRRPRDVWKADESPEFLEAFEFLRMNLALLGPEDGAFVVAVTSPSAAEGKTTVTAWLARSLAAARQDVVALDMDLSRPALRAYLSVGAEARRAAREPVAASARAAAGDLDGDVPPDERVHVLTARDHLGVQPGFISKGRMQDLVADVRPEADFVLVDTAPVSLAADATAVAAAVDGVVLVIDTPSVRRRDVLAARRQLDKARTNLVGVVLNRVAKRVPALSPLTPPDVPDDRGQTGSTAGAGRRRRARSRSRTPD
jgi:polysaccharide biosynthesis transport protein